MARLGTINIIQFQKKLPAQLPESKKWLLCIETYSNHGICSLRGETFAPPFYRRHYYFQKEWWTVCYKCSQEGHSHVFVTKTNKQDFSTERLPFEVCLIYIQIYFSPKLLLLSHIHFNELCTPRRLKQETKFLDNILSTTTIGPMLSVAVCTSGFLSPLIWGLSPALCLIFV